jgi:GT2 family glycosyltransferase
VVTPGRRVLAVLVVTDGEAWLPDVLTALEAQTYESLDVVAVDNGSTDRSRDLLLSRLSEDRVLVAEREIGFAGAVAMALDAHRDGDLVLLVHDDTALAPDAVERLVGAMGADPRLAIVGCKLVDWQDPGRLQSVGWSVDITGRADLGLEPDERDQGQRDEPRRPLVVSTAGMLLRRDVFDALGRFDRRYHVLRDDLDVCWRAWLAGWEVEVVPAAVARHVKALSNYRRLGQTAFLGPRYFAERNTLVTLLKNYGPLRLVAVVPLFLVVGLAKIVGFVATRRVGDAWQTLRAWAWNLVHLRGTLEERRRVQALRRRSDAELRPLFSRITPRLRAYAEALADRITGGGLDVAEPVATAAPEAEPETATARLVAFVRRHPVGTVAGALFVFGLVITLPLLPLGALRGGELAPFPTSPRAFFQNYASSWHDAGGVGTAAANSPAVVLVGLLQFVTLGNAYLASRLFLLSAIPVAWLLSLRAVKPLAPTRGPRVAAATLYALSPTALAAVRTGHIGTLVLVTAFPAVVSGLYVLLRRDAAPASAWRGVAATALIAAVVIAFAPPVALAFATVLVAAAVYVGIRPGDRAAARQTWVRLAAVAVGTLAALFPWSLTLFDPSGPVTGGAARPGADAHALWQWLLQAPTEPGFAGILAGAGAVAAGLFGLLVIVRRRPVAGLLLWGLALTGVVLATLTSRAGTDAWTWPGLPLVLVPAAFAGLFAVGLAAAGQQLATFDFGWRQVGAGLMVLAAVVGVGATAWSLLRDPWQAYVIGESALPAFIGAEAPAGGYRVLTLADEEGAVLWDLTGPDGPTMVAYGTPMPSSFRVAVDDAIADVVGGSDPGAAGRLGLLNVRYVFVPEAGRTDALERALASQLDLEPQPVSSGLVYRVSAFLPRVAWVPLSTVGTLERRGTPPPDVNAVELPLVAGTVHEGDVPGPGAILVSETDVSRWRGRLPDGRVLPARLSSGLVRIDLPEDARHVVVEHHAQSRRTATIWIQVLLTLLLLSLLLRPPGFAVERGARP